MSTNDEWTCTECGCNVHEVTSPHLSKFFIELDGEGYVLDPCDTEDVNDIISDLNRGFCPLCDRWDDGCGKLIADHFKGAC